MVLDSLQVPYEVLLVNDGSRDGSQNLLSGIEWPECKLINLAENFGHQRALEAGLSLARGDYVVTIDSDLQHPPRVIRDLFSVAQENSVDVVYAIRRNNVSNSFTKRITADVYYRLVNMMAPFPVPKNAADFRLISSRANTLLKETTSPRAFRVLVPSLRLPSAEVEFDVAERFSGESKYSLRHQLHLAILSVLVAPSRWLRLFGVLGLLVTVAGITELVYGLWHLVQGVSGIELLMISIVTISSGLLLSLMAFGLEYLVHLLSSRSPSSRYVISDISDLG